MTSPIAAVFQLAFDGEIDSRRDPERGAQLEALLDGLTERQLEQIQLACYRLGDATGAFLIYKFALGPMGIST